MCVKGMESEVIRLASLQDSERIDILEQRLDEMLEQLNRIEKLIADHCKDKDIDCSECKKDIENKIADTLKEANENLVKVIVAMIKNS